MQILFSRILLCLFLITFTPVKEILRIPLLFTHYNDHLQENPNLTFVDFIRIHYFDKSVKDADYEQDMQLPFKAVQDGTSLQVAINQIHPFHLGLTNNFNNDLHIELIVHDQILISSLNSLGTFHPPQFS